MFNSPAKRNKSKDVWYPFSDIENLHKGMNRLFDFSFPQFGLDVDTLTGGQWMPAVDVRNAANEIRVKADLPGFKKEDVKVSVEDDILTIKGERKYDHDVKEENAVRTERYYGSFERSFVLPSPIDSGKLNATFKDGVLELKLGKKEGAKPKQINIDIT